MPSIARRPRLLLSSISRTVISGALGAGLAGALLLALEWAPPMAQAATTTCGADLQACINAASAGDTLTVGAGTYNVSLSVDKTLTIQGAGRDLTILDGSNTGRVIAATAAITLQDLTIQNGHTDDDPGGGGLFALEAATLMNVNIFSNTTGLEGGGAYFGSTASLTGTTFSGNTANAGGGLVNSGGSAVLTNVAFISNTVAQYGGGLANTGPLTMTNGTFSGNRASATGGGMFNDGNNPVLTNVTFNDNTAADGGGGIFNSEGSLALTNVTFSGNKTSSGVMGYGGGLATFGGSQALTDVTFISNTAEMGGAMYSYVDRAILTNMAFISNTATIIGGGLYNDGGNPVLTNVTFSGNTAINGGGGMVNWSGSAVLTNAAFISNTVAMFGGGLVSTGPLTITNVTFSGNQASAGGGIYSMSSNPVLTNVTFSGNAATSTGGGMNNNGSNPVLTNVTFSGNAGDLGGGGMNNENGSNPQVFNTIFWGNTATPSAMAQIFNTADSAPVVSDSVIQDGCPEGSTCSNIITTDPLLGPLGNYGGFSPVLPLQPGSSAIDAGNDATCAATDQRGFARPQGRQCDVGAYEYFPISIAAFTVPGQIGDTGIDEIAGTIALTVPFGTNVTALAPTIVHTGASVNPATGVAQDFTAPVVYTVTAADTSIKAYTATVTVALNPAKAITAFTVPGQIGGTGIDEIAGAIALTVPFGTNVTTLVPTIVHTGVSVNPASGVAQDFTAPVVYTVTAADTSIKAYTATVTVALNPAKAITAFTVPGQIGGTGIDEIAGTIALTVPFGTNVTALVPTIIHTGASVNPASGVAQDFTAPVVYTVTAADMSIKAYTATVTVALNPAKAITGFTVPGQVGDTGIDQIAGTIALTVPFGTNVTAVVPAIVHSGASVNPATGVAQDFTAPVVYTVTAADSSTKTYTATVTAELNSAKAITGFTVPGQVGGTGINDIAGTIALTVPFGTNVTALVPTIAHTGASVNPASGVAQDFTAPVVYTVTAADSSTKTYTATVTVALNPAKAITAFTVPGQVGGTGIDEIAGTIALTVPFGTNVTALVPAIVHSGASVNPATGVAQDFTAPVVYTVTAADSSTKTYTATVTAELNSAKAITGFTVPGQVGGTGINEIAGTIALTVPFGTNVTALVPTIAHTGASVNPASGVAQDFTAPVVYTVTAADSSTKTYTATVTVALNPAKAITAFTVPGQVGGTGIDEIAGTIALTVPFGTNVTALVPAIVHSGASVNPASGVAQDFSSPMVYTVTAADASTKTYTATVAVQPNRYRLYLPLIARDPQPDAELPPRTASR